MMSFPGLQQLVPLPVVLPFGMAVVLAAGSTVMRRWLSDLLSLLTASATCGIAVFLARATDAHPIIYWFGGWTPDSHHFPVGISFVVDPLAAGAAAFVSLLVLLAFVVSSRDFRCVRTLYHVLMLAFLGAMCGMCLSGDLFNLFVWFELMSAAAIALCGYKCTETGPLQGALNLAVTNTIGAFLTLTGIGFLYAYTGSLNFAGIGDALRAHPPAPVFLAAAFLLTITGFLVKAAAFPFHFWLPDAHAVAPTPVCILFSGVMVQLGVYAVARLLFGVFLPAMQPWILPVRSLLLVVGTATTLLGALECFTQHHLKRMLAFSTISHTGLLISALALATPAALAGLLIYIVGHGLLKASLFAGSGTLLHRYGSLDEHFLHGKATREWGLGVVMIVGLIGLLAVPPFLPFYADGLIEHAREETGARWQTWIAIVASALTAAAVIRFVVRVFFGWGSRANAASDTPAREERETDRNLDHVPAYLWMPAAIGPLLAILASAWPRLRESAPGYAATLVHTHIYAKAVLNGTTGLGPEARSMVPMRLPYWPCLTAAVLTATLVAAIIWPMTTRGTRGVFHLWRPFHAFQSGRVTDYVAWLAAGLAAMGTMLMLQMR